LRYRYSYDNLSHLISVLHQLSGVRLKAASATVDSAGARLKGVLAQHRWAARVRPKGTEAMTFLILAFLVFLVLCYGAVKILRVEKVHSLGIRLNVGLLVFSIALLAIWSGLHSYYPPISIGEHWGMVLISVVGVLSMLLSTVAALKNLTGTRSGLVAVISIGVALAHLLNVLVSIPVS
jgi:hypothetical protein